ncbi:acylphosphatase [Lacicoccus alkaliphilus]|uniref:acylphosphatase n=1 Tax=Lacicoccus alkaliphilus DSM 16010 TaxID=1123231 RepID=A0A1M7B3R7_9BACL|nr:acylphosphatase [Salinicoccus alkaliphilus]SHL49309.1 acylphosphatase [Salinicoccus alkaliphilus DSM 16010]
MEAKLITLTGKVQGVGFRYHTKAIADQYGIKGYAKNLTEDVEVFAQGDEPSLAQFTDAVVSGPAPLSRVADYSVESVEPDDDYTNFKTL